MLIFPKEVIWRGFAKDTILLGTHRNVFHHLVLSIYCFLWFISSFFALKIFINLYIICHQRHTTTSASRLHYMHQSIWIRSHSDASPSLIGYIDLAHHCLSCKNSRILCKYVPYWYISSNLFASVRYFECSRKLKSSKIRVEFGREKGYVMTDGVFGVHFDFEHLVVTEDLELHLHHCRYRLQTHFQGLLLLASHSNKYCN